MPIDIKYLLPGFRPFKSAPCSVGNAEEKLRFLREDCHVLVIGAGGLGCEILKDLALSGFEKIDIIDMDTVDLSNLNRQFLFRHADIGRSKAEVAANYVNMRIPSVKVTPQFTLVIAGLDSVSARRWINATLVDCIENFEDGTLDQSTVIPLIDGGAEGFKGQTRVIIPKITSCFECSLDLYPSDPLNFPICTLAERPRQPEHCIQYIFNKWETYDEWKGIKFDKDEMAHMVWIYEKAKERGDQFGIKDVTFKLTQGVIKRIIPAVSSTNAIIAGSCVNEAFKFAIDASSYLNNYMAYNGVEGIYTHTFELLKRKDCPVCGLEPIKISVSPKKTLRQLLEDLTRDPALHLSSPSVSTGTAETKVNLYIRGLLEKKTAHNLDKALNTLIEDGDTLFVTDPNLPHSLTAQVKIQFV